MIGIYWLPITDDYFDLWALRKGFEPNNENELFLLHSYTMQKLFTVKTIGLIDNLLS